VRICSHIKADGVRCGAPARAGSGLCFFHDPGCQAARAKAQARGGKRKVKGVVQSAVAPAKGKRGRPAKKKAAAKPAPVQQQQPQQQDLDSMAIDPTATLEADQLEAILATAITKGTQGALSAPVLSNITRLVGIYESFLARKRERNDAEKARKLTTEELRKQMLRHLPTDVLVAECERRNGKQKANGKGEPKDRVVVAGHPTAEPVRGHPGGGDQKGRQDGVPRKPENGHRSEDVDSARVGAVRVGGGGAGAAGRGHTSGEVPAGPDSGATARPALKQPWRL